MTAFNGTDPAYFAYGSNMSSARLAARVPSARPSGVARLRDRRLVFDKPGRDGTAKANLVSAPGAVVWGVVYDLGVSRDPGAWEKLDRFEPGYRRVAVRCERPDGSALDARTYVFEGATAPGGPPVDGAARPVLAPSDEYLAHLVAGIREHGLPGWYLEQVLRAARG